MDWVWLLGVGLFTQLGQVWLTQGLTALPAARATSINYAGSLPLSGVCSSLQSRSQEP